MAKSKYTVLGLDPGTTNFGYAVLGTATPALSSFYPIVGGKIKNLVKTDMKDLPVKFGKFLAELDEILRTYRPNAVVMERFMNRGKFSGATGEYVSMMIALIIHHLMLNYPDVTVQIVQPGVWKTAFSRARGWKPAPRRAKGDPVVAKDKTPIDKATDYALCESHELDAYLMCHFAASHLWKITPFSHLAGAAGGRKLVTDFEVLCTGSKKRKRKVG